MDTVPAPVPRATGVPRLVLFALLLGTVLRVAQQVGRPFVGDEIGTLKALGLHYETLLTRFGSQLTMNHYFVLLKGLREAFGSSPWVLVLPTLVAGVATVFLAARIAQRIDGPRTAGIAALLCAVDPFLVTYSVRIRSYMLFVAFSLATLLAFLRWDERRTTGRGLACAALAVGAFLAHANALYPLAFVGLAFGRALYRERGRALTFVVPMAAAGALVLAAYAPLRADMMRFRDMWSDRPPTGLGYLDAMASEYFGPGWAAALFLVLVALGLRAALRKNAELAFLGWGVILPIALASFLGVSHYPWTYARFLFPILPLCLVLAARGVRELVPAARWDLPAALVACLAWIPALVEDFGEPGRHPYPAVARAVLGLDPRPGELFPIDLKTRKNLGPYFPDEAFVKNAELFGSPGPARLIVVATDFTLESESPAVALGEMQVLEYASAPDWPGDRRPVDRLAEDLQRSLGTRIGPELLDPYGFLMDYLQRRGRAGDMTRTAPLYYECVLRDKRQRGTPPQLLKRSTSSRIKVEGDGEE